MRRVVIPRPCSIEGMLVEEFTPKPLSTREVRIRVHRAGVNFADLIMRQGMYRPSPSYPHTPGYEVAGEITEVSCDVEGVSVGDRVVGIIPFGGYSEEVITSYSQVVPIPNTVTWESAAAMPVTYLTAYHMLIHLGNFQPGETLLVHQAAGGVGTAANQIAQLIGASQVFGTASLNKKEFVESLGMRFIDRERDFVQVCKEETSGIGVHHALDPVGGKHLLRSYKALREGGSLYVFGGSSAVKGARKSIITALKMVLFTPKFDPLKMMSSNKGVFGVHIGTWREEEVMKSHLESLVAWLNKGEINPVVDRVFPLGKVGEAHRYIHERKNRGKVLLDLS